MKKFKAKKIKKHSNFKIIFLILFLFSYAYLFSFLNENKLHKNILQKDINYLDLKINKIAKKKVSNIINNPTRLLNIKLRNVKTQEKMSIKTNASTYNIVKNNNSPIIYLYNTHQSEMYDGYSVYDATKYLNELLNKTYESIFEERSIKTFLDDNNLKYYKSYSASRFYINESIKKYPTIKYFFDIHRDSVSRDKSTITYNGKSYASILFLIGLENNNYNNNLNNAIRLSDMLNKRVSNISKGIIKKQGKNVNGVYNEDVSENLLLIEIGGLHNTKDEVINTVEVLKDAIDEYIGVV